MADAPLTQKEGSGIRFMESLTGAEGSQETVTQWLDRLDIQHQVAESKSEGYSWVLRATNSDGEVFFIGWMNEWGGLQVQATVSTEELHRQMFLMMSATDKVAFLADLSILIGTQRLDYSIVPHTEGDQEEVTVQDSAPASVWMSGTMLVDRPMYCSDFLSHFLRVQSALRSVVHTFSKMALLRRWA